MLRLSKVKKYVNPNIIRINELLFKLKKLNCFKVSKKIYICLNLYMF